MMKLVDWLSLRKCLNLLILLGYFAIILMMHDPMVHLSVFVMNYFTRQVYDVIVGIIAVVALCGVVYLFVKKIAENRHATDLKIIYLIGVVCLIFLHTRLNFVMNVELIHTIQFGLLAILIFPFSRRFGDTLFYTVLFAAVDEWFQYRILYPDKSDYYDFNDLLLDQLGAGLAIVLLFTAGANNKTYPAKLSWYRSPVFYITCLLATVATVLFKLSLLQVYGVGNKKAWIVLNESAGPEEFWRVRPFSDIVFHVIQPLEGLVILTVIFLLFFLLDYLAGRAIAPVNEKVPVNSNRIYSAQII